MAFLCVWLQSDTFAVYAPERALLHFLFQQLGIITLFYSLVGTFHMFWLPKNTFAHDFAYNRALLLILASKRGTSHMFLAPQGH